MNHLPDWNKPGSFSAGRDPLGLQAASVRLYTELLPGLTNVTNRLRYFSFYCWVVRQFELRRHTLDDRKWGIFIRRAEAAYVLSCLRGDADGAYGMAGSTWAGKHLAVGDKFNFKPWTDGPGEDGQYLKARWGNFGQFYVASMQQMHMLEESAERVQIVTKGYGLKLSEAFERTCPHACKELIKAIDDGIIGKAGCDAILKEAHPSQIDPASDEARLLTEYLCGGRLGDPTAPARRATLWNVLYIADQKNGLNELEIREELYAQDEASGVEKDELLENLQSWRAYFVNELCHIALEVLLNGLAFSINAQGAGAPETLAKGLASKALQAKIRGVPIGELASRVALAGHREEHAGGNALADVARRIENPQQADLEAAVTLILSLWKRWRDNQAMERSLALATVGGRSALGVFRFLNTLSEQPALNAITALIRKFIVGNHLLIAGQKLAGTGNFTYRFIVDEAALVDGYPAEYNFTTPRVGNLISFADDAGLLKDGKVTQAGKAFLRAVQPV